MPEESGRIKEVISFGEAGEDDLAVDPAALQRLEGGARSTMVLEDEDEAPQGASWPVVSGDRVVLAVYEDDEEPVPIAIVSSEAAGDPSVLAEIAGRDEEDRAGVSVVVGTGSPLSRFGRRKRGVTLWDAAVLISRAMALYVPLRLLAGLGIGGFAAFLTNGSAGERAANTGFFLAFALVGVLLWVKAPAIADRMVPAERRDLRTTPGKPEQLQSLLFSAIGLFILAESAPNMISSVGQLLIRPAVESEMGVYPERSFFIPQLLAITARLIVGLILLLGAERITGWLKTKRPSYESDQDDSAD